MVSELNNVKADILFHSWIKKKGGITS